MHVTVIGTGYVGTVTGACLSFIGHHVSCVDTDQAKIAKLKRGESPIYEPYLEPLIALAAARGGIEFTTEIGPAAAASDVIFIAVGTPPMPNGEPNLEYLESAARGIGAAIGAAADNRVSRGGEQVNRAGGFGQSGGNAGARRHGRSAARDVRSSASRAILNSCAKATRWPTRSIPTASWWARRMCRRCALCANSTRRW